LFYPSHPSRKNKYAARVGYPHWYKSKRSEDESNFGFDGILLSALKGGFFLRKEPLECEVSVYGNSEIATAD
jgi:hypothetical protein